MATAVHRLAKLHSMHTSGAAALIVNSPQFRLLLGQIQRLLPHFEVRRLLPVPPAGVRLSLVQGEAQHEAR